MDKKEDKYLVLTKKYAELKRKKMIIEQFQVGINLCENDIKTIVSDIFNNDLREFLLSKGYELENAGFPCQKIIIRNLRKELFRQVPYFALSETGQTIKFFWWYDNYHSNSIYWRPSEMSLDNFYNRKLKKILLLPIKVERKNKINQIKNMV
jgi:hypothetical protein